MILDAGGPCRVRFRTKVGRIVVRASDVSDYVVVVVDCRSSGTTPEQVHDLQSTTAKVLMRLC